MILIQTLCIVQSSRVGCQMPLSVSCWCQVMMLGGHSNKLVVTAVMVPLLLVCLWTKTHWKASHGSEEGRCIHPKGGNGVTVCEAATWALVVLDVVVFARGDLSINAQGHPSSVMLMGSPPCSCSCEVRAFALLSVIESPRMCVLRCGRRGELESRRCVMTRTLHQDK